MTHYQEKRGYDFGQQPVRNVCTEFRFDPLSGSGAVDRQAFTTQKRLPSEIPLTMKTVTSNSL